MMRAQLMVMAIVLVMTAICGFATGALLEVTDAPAPSTTTQKWQRDSNFRGSVSSTSMPRVDYKDLMSNLHDRVGVLVTLDEDQRNRLEAIDKKLDLLRESNADRMESIKAQQLDFKLRLDSFEHIQRLSRETLDEIKALSRPIRDVSQDGSTGGSYNPSVIDSNRLDSLATLLTSTRLGVRSAQLEVTNLSWKIRAQNKLVQELALLIRNSHNPTGSSHSLPTPDSCEYYELGHDGILKIKLTPTSDSFYVSCEKDWTVILSRTSDDVSFERGWQDYKEGFGNVAGDFFIGLIKLNALTSSALHELRIEMEDYTGVKANATYSLFAIGGESELFPLSLLGKFNASMTDTAGDALSYHAGAKFSTLDNDNDNCLDCNCAMRHKGAGWYINCATSNSFGQHFPERFAEAGETGIFWDTFRGRDYSVKKIRWMIRAIKASDVL
uniref:Angiopoietin-4 isoform X2 n=1 Tax=Drosophila rhopaloa TaxID=1041015 RepID=A0A6P4DZB7_DRORH